MRGEYCHLRHVEDGGGGDGDGEHTGGAVQQLAGAGGGGGGSLLSGSWTPEHLLAIILQLLRILIPEPGHGASLWVCISIPRSFIL